MRSRVLWLGVFTFVGLILGFVAIISQHPFVVTTTLGILMVMCVLYACRICALEAQRNIRNTLLEIQAILHNEGWDAQQRG